MENEDLFKKNSIDLKKAHFGQCLFLEPCPKALRNLWDSNSQMGNPIGNVKIHFLALSHICGRALEFKSTLSTYFVSCVLTLIVNPKLRS